MDGIISTQPPSEDDNLLRKKFYEDIASQAERVDKLSAHLLSIELAIPGLYASVLKLISGDDARLGNTAIVRGAFLLWFLALVATLIALTPRKWKVDPDVLVQDKGLLKRGEPMGIEDYFNKSARWKLMWAIISSLLFFAGVWVAVYTI